MDQPSARKRLEALTQQEQQFQQIQQIQQIQEKMRLSDIAATQAQTEFAEQQQQIATLKAELARLTTIASSSAQLNDDNIKLTATLKAVKGNHKNISIENEKLRNNVEQEWFIRGAGVILLGMLLGLLLPKLSNKKKRSWGSFEH
ncbi:MAG: SH3 domain protein [Saprospiraceae bacterium]|jgi:SH3 domain protein